MPNMFSDSEKLPASGQNSLCHAKAWTNGPFTQRCPWLASLVAHLNFELCWWTSKTCSRTRQPLSPWNIYINVLYIYITYWCVHAWFTGVSGIQKPVCCQRDISRVIFGFKSTREVLLAGTWDTDSEPVLDEPATRVLVLKGQVHR